MSRLALIRATGVAAMNDDKLEAALSRAARAGALMDNELLGEAFDMLDAQYIAAWRMTPARDAMAREKLWQAVHVVGLVRGHLARVLADGKLAQAELSMRAKAKERS
jgi:hypothetical protein